MNQQLLFKIRYEAYEEDFDINDWYQLELFELEIPSEMGLNTQD
ncbi:hypothetical protein [Fusobacterium sp. PH5-44]